MPARSEPTEIRERALSWFPGHMLKAQQRLADEIKHVDVVLEMRDARLPLLSGNPELQRMAGQRAHLVLLNKASLANPHQTALWTRYFVTEGVRAIFLDADTGKGLNSILQQVDALSQALLKRYRDRDIRPPPVRLMVTGMPNVGKSTLINRLLRKHRHKVAPMPGVTRHATWANLNDRYLLMDTPGIMLPRIDNEHDAFRLGWIGTIKDSVLGIDRVAVPLLEFILRTRPDDLKRWHAAEVPTQNAEAILENIGRQRGLLASGGTVNRMQAADWLLSQYRSGGLGRYTFEFPPVPIKPKE